MRILELMFLSSLDQKTLTNTDRIFVAILIYNDPASFFNFDHVFMRMDMIGRVTLGKNTKSPHYNIQRSIIRANKDLLGDVSYVILLNVPLRNISIIFNDHFVLLVLFRLHRG